MADTTSLPIQKCNTCQWPAAPDQPLSPCGRCNNVFYCSRHCQPANWGQHKNVRSNSIQPSSASNTNANPVPTTQPNASEQAALPPAQPALRIKIKDPFSKLSSNKWLHGRPEKDVYKLLIDIYRLRVRDDLFYKLEINVDTLYSQADDGGEGGFRHFLQRVESHPSGLLPSWWSANKAEECVELGLSDDEWCSLARPVNKAEIVDHYQDWLISMQLRTFGENIDTGTTEMQASPLFTAHWEIERRERTM